MSEKFEWQAEDDVVWEDLPADDDVQHISARRRRLSAVFLLVIMLVAATSVILRQVNRRIDTNSEAMREDILSTVHLIHIADTEQDEELFYSILSGKDGDWTAAQQDLFQAGLLHDRTPFGLRSQTNRSFLTDNNSDTVNISFSPDMYEAELTSERPYTINIGSGMTDTVTLKETSIYRLGHEKWLLAPPDNDFWGSWESLRGIQIRTSFPGRDKDLISQLLPDLERKLDEMCHLLVDITCPVDIAVEIQFSTDPASLAATAHPQTARRTNQALRITLPTPTLVGKPMDEAAYQALFRGYASQLITALISYQIGYSCCQQLPFYQALIDYQLDQLSLKPWPVSAENYERIRDEQMQLMDLNGLWQSDDPLDLRDEEAWRVYGVVDYLLKADPGISPAVLQKELLRRSSFFGWLNGSFSSQNDSTNANLHSDLMRQFWLQAYPQATLAGADTVGRALEQDLLLTCEAFGDDDPDFQISRLLRYDVIKDKWAEKYQTANHLFLNPLPGDDSFVVLEALADGGRWQTSIWRDGRLIPILSSAGDQSVSFGQTDPSGSNLLAFVFPSDGGEADITSFDLNDCTEETGCASRIIPSIPIWSPDGSQAVFGYHPNSQLDILRIDQRTILFDSSGLAESLYLYLIDRQTLMMDMRQTPLADMARIGKGHAPFWLDNESVAYVDRANTQFSRPAQEVVFTDGGENGMQTLLSADDLAAHFPDNASIDRVFWIQYLMTDPVDPNSLFVVAFDAWEQQAYLFSYDRTSEEVAYLMKVGYTANHALSPSPDGQFLVMTGNAVEDPDQRRENMLLLVHDLANAKTTPFLAIGAEFPPFQSYDWSANGQWLAMMLDHDLIGLYSPQESVLHLIETAAQNCASPSWVNR